MVVIIVCAGRGPHGRFLYSVGDDGDTLTVVDVHLEEGAARCSAVVRPGARCSWRAAFIYQGPLIR
jgi:hypothetical protein